MPRENSFSDDGASLTSEESYADNAAPVSPTYSTSRQGPAVRPTSPAADVTPSNGVKIHASPSKRSIHSHRPVHGPPISPKARFKSAVRKVMFMRRGAHGLSKNAAGAEPGIDPRRATADIQFGHIRQNCIIELFDYSAVRHSYGRMTNLEFVKFMSDDKASQPEQWVKVRWINIAGLSWDVIKAVSLKYDMHPLALEDVFRARSQTRSKADYYSSQLFLRAIVHELSDPDAKPEVSTAAYGSTLTELPRSSSPLPFTSDDSEAFEMKGANSSNDETVYDSLPRSKSSIRQRTGRQKTKDIEKGKSTFTTLSKLVMIDPEEEARKVAREEEVAIAALKQASDSTVNVKVYPMFIFLFRNGTVISLNTRPDVRLTQQISDRLQRRDGLLRKSADPSLLIHALLDLVVDKALEVIDEYQVKIQKAERDIMVHPKIKTVRGLHVLSGDLILHKRTMEPLKTLVYGLRRYDLDRCAALVENREAGTPVVGFMSHKTKIYLADVVDHVEYILSSLDMFADISQNLIDYTFNMTSYNMNEDMRKLTLATIIFLPLTLLTGYFGMNFDNMWSVHHNHSDILFWEIALPVMAIVVPLFLFPDLQRFGHFVHKKMIAKQAVASYRS